jgi:short-subunit dehydrogenase involved in D-alanine esterification of teichoic acids
MRSFKKIAITGHTSGIGLNLFEVFAANGHEVTGYSRRTGADIEDPDVRKRIIDENADCDIFINNAYSPNGQTKLLEELVAHWDSQPKKIINVSSKLSFFELGKVSVLDDYIKQKSQQNEIIQQRFSTAYPQIMNVVIGLVDTPMSTVFQSPKLDPQTLSEFIYKMSIVDDLYIQQVIVDVPGLDWKNIKGP